ncbi:hypothetical protein E2P81_ATG02069 [Venturia nashicola]|uniref:Fork-head domain-containing protein n=1 Tax=Venturia nashicola TaxID=86259 RepID=A0A4Z1PLK8_9PEZI|nr:hypothetical protein E6O75_ATG02118 [Venturia nashicola]TLD35766.1 hypothetical protein E2P81_ATG02069 [Venturia nashicola]
MDGLKIVSGGTSGEGIMSDKNTTMTGATRPTPIDQTAPDNLLVTTNIKSEPPDRPAESSLLETETMEVDGGNKPTAGGDDRAQIDATLNDSNKQKILIKTSSEDAKVEDKEVDTQELGVSGTSAGLNRDLGMAEVAIVAEQKTTLSTSVKPEPKNHDIDMVELEADDLVRSTEKTKTQSTQSRADPPTGKNIAEPSDKEKMDIDSPEASLSALGEKEEVEEVEPTDSKIWLIPSVVDDGNKPQLSLQQLLIVSLVSAPARTLSLEEICQWINDGFQYYKNLTFQHTLHPLTINNWMGELNDILHRYDFVTEPILQTEKGGDNENGKVVLYLPPGREWHILPKPGKMQVKPFRFLDLPFDLRLMVLEFALVRPLPKKHGWIIDPVYTAKRKENYRNPRRVPQRLKEEGPYGWELRTDGLDVVLAVLSVSKQVYAEAAPVFYRGNFLEFDSAVTLGRFLDGVPFRKKWIRNLVLHYDPPMHGHACTRTFTLLRDTKLRNLHLYLNEDRLIRRHELTRFSDPIPRLPGMKALVELRGLKKLGLYGPHLRTLKFLGKITDWKRNDMPDEDEQMVNKRKREQEKYHLAIMRSFVQVRNANHKKAAEALKVKHAKERDVRKRKHDEERKVKAEDLAREKKEKVEAKEMKRKEREEAKASQAKVSRKVQKVDKKNIKAIIARKNGGKVERPADEDTSSEEEESSGSKSKSSEKPESEDESEDEEASPPPPKRTKTLAAAKREASAASASKSSAANNKAAGGRNSKIPIKPAPAPRPLVTKSATGVRRVTTKGGIVAKGSSSSVKKTAPAVKKTVVRKIASGVLKKSGKGGRRSDMASVFEVADNGVLGESD